MSEHITKGNVLLDIMTPEELAATVIELKEENARLREALKCIAGFEDPNYTPLSEYDKGLGHAYRDLAQVARAALEGEK